MRWFPYLFCFLLPVCTLVAEEREAQSPAVARSVESLKTIAEPLATALAELQKLQGELDEAQSEDAKDEIRNRIDSERERVRSLRDNFRNIVGGSEAAEYDGEAAESAGIQEQFSELVQPVLSEIREATSEPRQLDKLRKFLDEWQERKRKADTVLGRIDDLIAIGEDATLVSELNSARGLWASRQAEAISQIAVLKVQIDERTRDQRSMWKSFQPDSADFSKTAA